MSRGVRESDWKLFRELRERALERFTERTLKELVALADDASLTHHQRYLAIWELLRDRDRQLARAFDNSARSRMLQQLIVMHAEGIVESEEFGRFTEQTRATVESLLEFERSSDRRPARP